MESGSGNLKSKLSPFSLFRSYRNVIYYSVAVFGVSPETLVSGIVIKFLMYFVVIGKYATLALILIKYYFYAL
jgi:hypothetical protein